MAVEQQLQVAAEQLQVAVEQQIQAAAEQLQVAVGQQIQVGRDQSRYRNRPGPRSSIN